MKIECKLKREGGSTIDIGGVAYEFKPQADGAHVADVGNKEHAERFLSIPEAYGIYAAGKPVKEAPAPVVEEHAAEETVETVEANEAAPVNVTLNDIADDLDALKAAYKAKFGSLPHYKWTAETIKAKLAE